jgi:DNA repair exonuclease SbcCD ATPase subunit
VGGAKPAGKAGPVGAPKTPNVQGPQNIQALRAKVATSMEDLRSVEDERADASKHLDDCLKAFQAVDPGSKEFDTTKKALLQAHDDLKGIDQKWSSKFEDVKSNAAKVKTAVSQQFPNGFSGSSLISPEGIADIQQKRQAFGDSMSELDDIEERRSVTSKAFDMRLTELADAEPGNKDFNTKMEAVTQAHANLKEAEAEQTEGLGNVLSSHAEVKATVDQQIKHVQVAHEQHMEQFQQYMTMHTKMMEMYKNFFNQLAGLIGKGR